MIDKNCTIRIWQTSVSKLRLIYGLTGEKMVNILDRLITAELQRIYQEGRNTPGLPVDLSQLRDTEKQEDGTRIY